jgi:16S rRNA (guanine1207-N2)-methyltransferase
MVGAMSNPSPPIRIAEARALDQARALKGTRILCTTLGRAQAARVLASERPAADVACWILDQHHLHLAAAACGETANLSLELSPDAPDGARDLAVVPLATRGEAELARDLIQSAWQQLDVGGMLVVAVDNREDRWVRAQLEAWCDKVRVDAHEDAMVYTARKDTSPRKLKNFRCEFAFRDRGRLIHAVSRPGVFSHRRIDAGARRLLEAAELPPAGRALDLGCGSGVVALAVAARDPTAQVFGVDSHSRAVACTQEGAELNGLQNVTVELNASFDLRRTAEFDLALLNPPYYGDFVLAERFLEAAHDALKPGGVVQIVTKGPDWYRQSMPGAWSRVDAQQSKSYWIVSATRP